MSDPESTSTAAASEASRTSLWKRLRTRFGKNREKGLRESLEGALETHEAQNPGESFKQEAKSMMLNIIEFSGLRVDDVMVPRVDIVAIDEEDTMRDLLEKFIEANHSRVPVYRETLDGISGMVHVKDFMRWMNAKGARKAKGKSARPQVAGLTLGAAELSSRVKQSGLHREVLFVPPSMPASDLLVRMQASHIHLAIVIDEYGGTDGLVSIEDLVEVIVGDISDEHDTDDDLQIKPADEGLFQADGRADLANLEEILKIDLLPEEDDEETDTLAGLVFKLAGRVPARGEIIRHDSGLEFEILDSDPRRVKRVRINARNMKTAATETASGDQAAI